MGRKPLTVKILFNESSEILKEAGLSDPKLEIPKSSEYGDVSCTSAFELARRLNKSPMEVALDIASKVKSIIERKKGLIKSVEVIRPGFINFYADWPSYAVKIIEEVLSAKAYGSSDIGKGRRVLIEHTSVNPNKALHVGHARNVCLGSALARLYEFAGFDVLVANYIDDSGSQMADIILGIRHLGYPIEPPEGMRFDEYCGDKIYVEVNRLLEQNPQLSEKKRQLIKEIEDRSSDNFMFSREIAIRVLKEQLKTCWRLGASYDILNRESDVVAFGLWEEVFSKLKKNNACYLATSGPKANCWLLDLSGHKTLSKEGDEVLVKSDGTTTYVARDIAYAAWKLGIIERDFKYKIFDKNKDQSDILITDIDGEIEFKLKNIDMTITVVDVRQRRPQEIVKYALGLIGADSSKYVHFAYEVVSLSTKEAERMGLNVGDTEFVHMKGREGIYVKVDSVIDSIKKKVMYETAQRHPEWPPQKVEHVAENVAIGALVYALVKGDADKIIIFDREEALKIEGDTGPYLQYSYARACRILEKSPIKEEVKRREALEKQEIALLREISLFPLVVEESVKLMLLKKLANYAYNLASAFNNFYESCPVLTDDEETMKFRLSLIKAYLITMGNCLRILGIPIVEEM
ncbi:MAG: arginine--tRNA ligase [Nitrososphaerota archaeon]|nr:arginine--tRNA ligase [Aigarchaeota archaeon]MDW8077087.1 arginine--tRNA ligase [Nitrososphaerota archaeon]